MGNKILLLGSTGIVGRTLSENLDVIPISRNECDLFNHFQVESLLSKYTPDIVINCAGNVTRENTCLEENMKIFLNLLDNKDKFGKYINFGSGAEFDRLYSIDYAEEETIKNIIPLDEYGFVKNQISRMCLKEKNFYTLRLFGLLSKYDNFRFFSKLKNDNFQFYNRKFDYFSSEDLITVVKYFCENNPVITDVNLVYKEKYRLSDYVRTIYKYNKIDEKLKYENIEKNYTGSSDRLYSLKIPLIGIGNELMGYKI